MFIILNIALFLSLCQNLGILAKRVTACCITTG